MNKIIKYIVTVLLVAVALASFILFEVIHVKLVEDAVTNYYLCGILDHLSLCILILWLSYVLGTFSSLRFNKVPYKKLLWCLPCLLVVIANFPIGALISGQVYFIRSDIIALYILYVFLVAILEELVFRGFLLFLLLDLFRNQKYKYFLAALFSSLIFALFHLTNLFIGMDIISVLLQMVYTFLIGGMLAIVVLKVRSIWPCIIIHALFDFGGLLTPNIAAGDPWDVTFWILTISCGILCAGHMIFSLINLEKKNVSWSVISYL